MKKYNVTKFRELKEMIKNEIDYLHLRRDLREDYLCDLYEDLKTNEQHLKDIRELYEKNLKLERRQYMMSLRNEEIKVTEKHIEEVKEIISFIEPKIAELEKNGRIDILSKYQGNGE